MQKIFITGGKGYMGSRLIPILLDQGHQVNPPSGTKYYEVSDIRKN